MSKKKDILSLEKVITGGFWLYLDAILVSFVGYVYWLLISRIANPSVLGYASATISFAVIVQTVITFGIPTGVQRFLGRAFGNGDYKNLKKYLFSSLLFLLLLSLVTTILMFIFSKELSVFIGINTIYIILASFLVFFTVIKYIFRSFLISILQVNKIFIFDIIANIGRLFLGVYLVILGFGGVGAVLGYVFSGLIALILFGIYSFKLLCNVKSDQVSFDFSSIKDSLEAGVVSWVPGLVSAFGIQSGILILFGSSGAAETGIYFMAFAIFSVLAAFPNTFLGLLFPVLSGLKEGHEKSTQRTLNLVLSLSTPLAIAIAIYSKPLLSYISPVYGSRWLVLTILALSVPFSCVVSSVNSFVYALGKYKVVFAIGIAMNLSRVLFYILLVPFIGSLGAAYAFDAGILVAFFVVLYYTKRSNLSINLKIFVLVVLFSMFIGCILWLFTIPWYIGSITLVIISELIFARAKIYTKQDVHEIALALLSEDIIKKITPKIYPILKILFGE